MSLMEDIAFHITEDYNENRLLCEDISDDDLRRLTAVQFPNEEDVLIKTLLNSLLVPKTLFRDSRYTIHFTFRIYHEFFLARYSLREGIAINVPNSEVTTLIEELRTQNVADMHNGNNDVLL